MRCLLASSSQESGNAHSHYSERCRLRDWGERLLDVVDLRDRRAVDEEQDVLLNLAQGNWLREVERLRQDERVKLATSSEAALYRAISDLDRVARHVEDLLVPGDIDDAVDDCSADFDRHG